MAKSKSVSVVTGLVPLRIFNVKMKKKQKSEKQLETEMVTINQRPLSGGSSPQVRYPILEM